MDYGPIVDWNHQVMAVNALIGMSLVFSDAMLGRGFLRKLAAQATPYVISVIPVGLLVYMLYIVSGWT